MRYLLLLVLAVLASCENNSFDSDKRQLTAKDEIRNKLHRPRSFDITGFRQDTVEAFADPIIIHPLRYSLDVVFTDSTGQVQKKKGIVLFTPDGKSVLSSHIVDAD